MSIEGTCVCGYGPLRATRDRTDQPWTITHAPSDRVAVTNCPTCARPLNADQLLPADGLWMLADSDLEPLAQLLQVAGDCPRQAGSREMWARVATEQSLRAGVEDPDRLRRATLADALGEARQWVSAMHQTGSGEDASTHEATRKLAALVAALEASAR